jgi:hypothetical protein
MFRSAAGVHFTGAAGLLILVEPIGFQVTPTVGWQIDPFGASSVVAEHNTLSGFKYHIIDRINWRLKTELEKNLAMEFVWQPSKSLGKNNQILTHILDANYCDPMLSVRFDAGLFCSDLLV